MKIIQLIKYFLYRFKWYTARYINYSSPVHLDLELSTRCNLNCKFCFRQDYKYSSKDMDYDLANYIIDEAEEMGVKSIKFNWRGEALLNSEFSNIFRSAKISNLYTMLNTSLAQELSANELGIIAIYIDELDVSIDSMHKETYEKIRKGASFERTLINLRHLYDYRQKHNMPSIIINRRTSELTIESDEQFMYQLSQIGKFKFDIRPAMPRNKEDFYFEDIYYIGEFPRQRKYCGQPSRRMVVDVEGDVWACCVSYTDEEALFLGNIKDENLSEIWDSEKRKGLVGLLKYNIFNNETCKNCASGEAYK